MSNFIIIKGEKFTTPTGRFQYPKLIEPDTKFHAEGEYRLQVVIEAGDAQQLADSLDQLLTRHKESLKTQAPTQKFKLADLPWGFDTIDGLPVFVVKTKMKASGVDREGKSWSRKPALFDAKGKAVTDRESLRDMWSGTIGRCSFLASPFYTAAIGAGITLRLQAAQIITLVQGGGDASSHGFGEEVGWTPDNQEQEVVPWDASPVAADDGDF